jgi:hypothetical protein
LFDFSHGIIQFGERITTPAIKVKAAKIQSTVRPATCRGIIVEESAGK